MKYSSNFVIYRTAKGIKDHKRRLCLGMEWWNPITGSTEWKQNERTNKLITNKDDNLFKEYYKLGEKYDPKIGIWNNRKLRGKEMEQVQERKKNEVEISGITDRKRSWTSI